MKHTVHQWIRRLGVLAVVALIAPMHGCIAWEIRDELRTVNGSLAQVQSRLDETNALIGKVEHRLDLVQETNAKLDALQARLTLLDPIKDPLANLDGDLDTLQKRLDVLNSMDASMRKLDEHLASLRKTIANIDSSIPFLSISGDKDDPAQDSGDAKPAETPPSPQPDGKP